MLRTLRTHCPCVLTALTLMLLAGSAAEIAAQTPPITGRVLTSDGRPIEGVQVSAGICCWTITNERGEFLLERQGAVIHVADLNGRYQPRTIMLSGNGAVRVTLETPGRPLMVPTCRALDKDEELLGWGPYGVQFIVSRRDVNIRKGKVDVDYVRHLVTPKRGKSVLALWFGPYALGLYPDEELFTESAEYDQRHLAIESGMIGTDTKGRLRSGFYWRQTGAVGDGAIYRNATPEDARIFDAIMDGICRVPDPEQ